MKYHDEIIDDKEHEIIKQVNRMTAFGINGLGMISDSKDKLVHEYIEADKEKFRE